MAAKIELVNMIVFISYRRTDSEDITGRIYDRLVEKFGKDAIFKDVDAIPLGSDFRRVIEEAVGKCQVLLAIIGKEWLSVTETDGSRRLDNPQDFVRLEIEAALNRGIPVIPVLVRGAKMPKADDLPPVLQNLAYHNGIQVRADPDFHHDMERLIRGIEQLIPESQLIQPSQETITTRQPTKVSGNIMKGKRQKIDVQESGAQVEENVMEGEDLELNVGDSATNPD